MTELDLHEYDDFEYRVVLVQLIADRAPKIKLPIHMFEAFNQAIKELQAEGISVPSVELVAKRIQTLKGKARLPLEETMALYANRFSSSEPKSSESSESAQSLFSDKEIKVLKLFYGFDPDYSEIMDMEKISSVMGMKKKTISLIVDKFRKYAEAQPTFEKK